MYVVGMDVSGDENALEILRGPNHFGQYGNIIKIAASKAKEGYAGHQSTGIYVTFADNQAAKNCIDAIDGTLHEGRVLRYVSFSGIDMMALLTFFHRAQNGTTKYCSAFLRNERCTNRSCMFLHETSEDNDSFSRADLSSLNAASSQRLAPAGAHTGSRAGQASSAQAQSLQAVQSSAPQTTKSEAMSRSDSGGGEGPALPATANWAKNPQIEQSRRSSQTASRATPSPKAIQAKMVLSRPDSRAARPTSATASESKGKAPQISSPEPQEATELPHPTPKKYQLQQSLALQVLEKLVEELRTTNWAWSLNRSIHDEKTLNLIDNYPPLIDPQGGAKLAARKKMEEEKRKEEAEAAVKLEQSLTLADDEENLAGGSHQLGGEPENGDETLGPANNSRRQTPFGGILSGSGLLSGETQPFDRQVSLTNDFSNLGIGPRSLTPQQQRNITLFKSAGNQQDTGLDQPQRGPGTNTSQHHSQLSNPFQSQNQQLSALSRHGRHASRYTFANDSSSASTAIKPATNAQLLAQQSAMMPQNQHKGFVGHNNTQPNPHINFYSGVQGPPPGLKASGTPPISGGGMFGQGHGFASAMGGGANFNAGAGKNNSEENSRDMIRGRMGGGGGGVGADAGKSEFLSPTNPNFGPFFPMPPGLDVPVGNHLAGPLGHPDHVSAKSKKKGKRHRHANTSSVGGGASVDLADPSILQARMHHTGVGQGPYGGPQNQGGYNSHGMMYGGGFVGRW